MKAHLKTSLVRQNIIVSEETGEIVESTVKEYKYVSGSAEEFYMIFASFISILDTSLSLPEIKIYAYILKSYNSNTAFELGKKTKTAISTKYGLNFRTVENSIYKLKAKNLLLVNETGMYMINSRYAFKGGLSNRKPILQYHIGLENNEPEN